MLIDWCFHSCIFPCTRLQVRKENRWWNWHAYLYISMSEAPFHASWFGYIRGHIVFSCLFIPPLISIGSFGEDLKFRRDSMSTEIPNQLPRRRRCGPKVKTGCQTCKYEVVLSCQGDKNRWHILGYVESSAMKESLHVKDAFLLVAVAMVMPQTSGD